MKRRSFAEPHSTLNLFALAQQQQHANNASNGAASAGAAGIGGVQPWISAAEAASKPRRSPGKTARRFSAFVGSNIGLAARRGSAMPVLQHEPEFEASSETKPQQVLGLRSDEWNKVQTEVISVFQKRKLQPGELYELNKMVKVAIKSEIGSFISEYYKKNLLQRGMKILFESLDNDEGPRLLASLSELWNYFFCEILPTLRAIFYPVQTKGLTMYQLSLLGFRDHVVLQLPLSKALSTCNEREIPAEITQMFLNLHAVHDGGNTSSSTPSEEYVQLEVLLAKVVCPFLGSKGLYLRIGEDDPAVPARDPNAKDDGQSGTPGAGTPGRKYDRQRSLQRLSLQIQPSGGMDLLAYTASGSTPSSPLVLLRENSSARRLQLGHGQRRGSALALSSLETLEEVRVDRSGTIGHFRDRQRTQSEIEVGGRR